MSATDPISALRQTLYQQRLHAEHLQREFFEAGPAATDALFDELKAAESTLAQTEAELAAVQAADTRSGLLVSIDQRGGPSLMLGAQTTGLSAQVHLRMSQVPTAIYHLLDPEANPLISCQVTNHSQDIRRLRVTSYIEGYSAQAIHTAEINGGSDYTFSQLPTLFPERIYTLNELTRATLNVLVEDLDSQKIESHSTHPIWMLARNTATLLINDPTTGEKQDMTPYLGAFVTPNAPTLLSFLREAANLHPQKRLVGYQGDKAAVEPQVQALFEALKRQAGIAYVNSVIAFSPDQGTFTQRVRLPRESLAHKEANCIDGTVLFASLLEGISLNPALITVPGHAFLAWESWSGTAEWRFLETTMIGTHSFTEACSMGEAHAARYQALAQATGKAAAFSLWPVRVLRSERGILPME